MAQLIDIRDESLLEPDLAIMIKEFKEGKQIGEDGRVAALKDQFSWKRSFVNCWTGNPNAGKTTFQQFMAVVKSKYDGWKWCIWSREMINAYNDNGKIRISASDIYDEIIHMITGKNPYKHFTEMHGIEQMTIEEYMEALDWVEKHFYVIEPKDKSYESIIDTFMYLYEKKGFDGFIIDPFKNLKLPDGRTDDVLHRVFDDFKECSLKTNTSVNIIAHPKSSNDNKNQDGSFKLVTQYELSGGAAWNNSMDGIFSVYRPFIHKNPNDKRMYLYHLKQRKKHLVGLTGVYKDIEFNWKTNRYYFDGYCPLDGSYMEPIFDESKKRKAAEPIENKIKMPVNEMSLKFEQETIEYGSSNEDDPGF